MKIEHTPEPWSIEYVEIEVDSFHTDMYPTLQANGMPIVSDEGFGTSSVDYANAERIVACINACAGIDNKVLTHAGVVQRGELGDVIRQRDILLGALKDLLIDVKISQNNMRDAEKTDSRWEGCADAIQPRVDSAQAALDFVNNVNKGGQHA